MSGSRNIIFAVTPFDDKYQNLQKSIFTFFICAKVQSVVTIVTDTRTQKRTIP